MTILTTFLVFISILVIVTETIRKFLIYKAYKHERKRRSKAEEGLNLGGNTKPK